MGSGLYALEELFESGSGRQARRFRPQARQISAIQSGTPLAEITSPFITLVSRPRNTMTFADGSCEVRSRSEEKAMQGHRRRRATQRSPATPISPKGGGGTASISLSLLLHDVTDIASSSLRELDAVALATNVTVFMERGT